jgi:hypothetical protein
MKVEKEPMVKLILVFLLQFCLWTRDGIQRRTQKIGYLRLFKLVNEIFIKKFTEPTPVYQWNGKLKQESTIPLYAMPMSFLWMQSKNELENRSLRGFNPTS